MRKISEYQNEDALDLLAEIIEPASEFFSDKKFEKIFRTGTKMQLVQHALKHHKKAVLKIMAVLEGVPVKEYKCNVFTLPMQILEILGDEELISFFASQGMKIGNEPSGSATENTEGIETK